MPPPGRCKNGRGRLQAARPNFGGPGRRPEEASLVARKPHRRGRLPEGCRAELGAGRAEPVIVAAVARAEMPVTGEVELVGAYRDVRALIFKALAQLAPRRGVQELLPPVEGLALLHLDVRKEGREQHGTVDFFHGPVSLFSVVGTAVYYHCPAFVKASSMP